MTIKNPDILIFCDSSFDPKSKTGIGGMLLLSGNELSSQNPISELKVTTKLFANMTNTRLELITVLWALNLFKKKFPDRKANKTYYPDAMVISDCKTILDLPSRREQLQKVGFKGKRTGKLLSNADLYKEYFLLYDEIRPEIVWLKGHSSSRHHNVIQSLFSQVDRTTRARLREFKAAIT